VLPLDGLFETLRMTLVTMDSSLHEMESEELRGKVDDGSGRSEGVSEEDERRLRV